MLLRSLAGETGEIGGKAAGLRRLAQAGFPVPDAFVLDAELFRAHLARAQALPALAGAAASPEGRRERLAEARDRIAATPLDGAVVERVRSGLASLGGGAVAVRSSAAGEDSEGDSFAGQHDTVLGVEGEAACADAVRRCWASAFSERAFGYRIDRGLDPADVRMGVVVQRMAAPRAAGVAFSRDPVGGSDRVVVEAVAGLGEALVSGREAPDRWELSRSGEIAARATAGAAPCLDDADARRVAALALRIEEAFGAPQDVEWALAQDELLVLQARPITTLAAPLQAPGIGPAERQVWSNTNFGELLPDVATPMTFSVALRIVQDIIGPLLERLGLPADLPVAGLVGGRLYVNMNAAVALFRRIPGLRRKSYADYFGGDREVLAPALARLTEADLPRLHVNGWRFWLRIPGFVLWIARHAGLRAEPVVERMQRDTQRLAQVDLAALADEQLVPHVERLLRSMRDAPDGFAMAMVGAAGMNGLASVCRRWLGDADGALAGRLLSGVGGLDSAEAGLALWRLAEAGRAPGVLEVLQGDAPFARVREALSGSEPGRAFLAAWDGFLARHGHHTRAEVDVAVPRWREQPDYLLSLVRGYLASPAATSPVEQHRRRAQEGEGLAAQARARLGPVRRRLFDLLLDRARRGVALRETAKSELVRRVAIARATLLEAGRRLVARGLAEAPDDVFQLLLEELPDALAGRKPGLRALVRARRAAEARHRLAAPPPVVAGRWEPQSVSPPVLPPGTAVLRGVAVSPGVAVGRARVILRSDTDERVLPGEILVAPFTDPGWTPYFLPAAGIVMDLGGVLSHGSVVAREYGIPAVVNVGPATRLVRTGQWLRVDALRGEVHLLADGPAPGERVG